MSEISELSTFNTEIEYLSRIRSHYDFLSESEKKIANYILEHKEAVLSLTANDLSKCVGTSASTIIRFCYSLDFKGYNDLKYYIQRQILSQPEAGAEIKPDDSMNIIKQKLINYNKDIIDETLNGLDTTNLEMAVDAIVRAKNIDIYGEGGSGISAMQLGYLFLQIGLKCRSDTDSYIQIMSASQLGKGDVAIALSHSGRSINTIDSMKTAKRRGATTICITGCIGSPLTKYADIKLYSGASLTSSFSDLAIARLSEMAVITVLQTGIVMKDLKRFNNRLINSREMFEIKRLDGPASN